MSKHCNQPMKLELGVSASVLRCFAYSNPPLTKLPRASSITSVFCGGHHYGLSVGSIRLIFAFLPILLLFLPAFHSYYVLTASIQDLQYPTKHIRSAVVLLLVTTRYLLLCHAHVGRSCAHMSLAHLSLLYSFFSPCTLSA